MQHSANWAPGWGEGFHAQGFRIIVQPQDIRDKETKRLQKMRKMTAKISIIESQEKPRNKKGGEKRPTGSSGIEYQDLSTSGLSSNTFASANAAFALALDRPVMASFALAFDSSAFAFDSKAYDWNQMRNKCESNSTVLLLLHNV